MNGPTQVVVAPTASDSAKAVARGEAEALVDSIVAGRDFAELATRLRSGASQHDVVRDPDLLESDGPEWTTLGEDGSSA